jgi:hypothetical protein
MRAAPRVFRAYSTALAALLGALFAAAVATGCATVQRDVLVRAAGDADFSRLDALADESAALRAAPDANALARARSDAAAMRAQAPLNDDYRARLAAISGDLALLAGDRGAASAALAEAQAARGDDEWVFLLRSRLAEKPEAKEAALLKGLSSASSTDLLKAELGLLRYKQGRYREAVASLDDALGRLREAQRSYYGPVREAALPLVGAEDSPRGSAAYVASDPVSLLGLAVIVQENTGLLNYITGAKAWASGALFARLSGAGLFGPGPVAQGDPATRSRAAFFFWSLVAAREENDGLLRAYSGKYASRGGVPVPDVALGSWYFDAALGCVEREILSLPDGESFSPDATISGAEALKAARKAAE